MLLHYLNIAVSECIHLQNEEFVPNTFFSLFDQFMCIHLKQLTALFRKLGLFSSLIHLKSCALRLTCLQLALKEQNSISIFIFQQHIVRTHEDSGTSSICRTFYTQHCLTNFFRRVNIQHCMVFHKQSISNSCP